MKKGSILVGDRCFASYFGVGELLQREIDGVFRMHQRRKIDFRRGRCLGITDISWSGKSQPVRNGWTKQRMDKCLKNFEVRQLRYQLPNPATGPRDCSGDNTA